MKSRWEPLVVSCERTVRAGGGLVKNAGVFTLEQAARLLKN
ncbi:MAG TPA: hypothetical protein VJ943_08470 [Desulfotignum sp.]|nr:hypothetical protein [Desulfotignum sp.]